jgi:hypothetical protein
MREFIQLVYEGADMTKMEREDMGEGQELRR